MNRRVHTGVVAGILLFASGCGHSLPGTARSALATIARADKLTLYEGLPHPGYEPEAVANERKTKATVDLHNYAFYREPLTLKPEDAAKLKTMLADPTRFAPFAGEKKCGGFHPDYAVEWTVAGQVYQCLVCFGCFEVMVYGSSGETRLDIVDTDHALAGLLKPYQKNRPAVIHAPG